MNRIDELQIVKKALLDYGEAVYDHSKQKILDVLVKRIEHLMNEFWVTPGEFKTLVNAVVDETEGHFPSVLILEIVFPKVPIMETPQSNPLWN